MMFQSTRDSRITASAAQAVCRGIAPDGGLYIPTAFPSLELDRLISLQNQPYVRLAEVILQPFFEDWPEGILKACLDRAYGSGRFDVPQLTPTRKLDEGFFVLELWHGPTAAFKDMALQFLPPLLAQSKKLAGDERTTVILTATSGDTGKAALEGFADQPGTRILVFYPSKGVSEIQRRQMVTQSGSNVDVVGIEGNFDDAQTAVKQLFADPVLAEKLAEKNMVFSSANSINFGRLAPQIVYYFKSYLNLISAGEVQPGEPVNFAVPTGNFGNILAGYYAKRMGLPIGKLICASNANHVLSDFFATASYNRNRPFIPTESPSMDILISSNLERLISHLAGPEETQKLMKHLADEGAYILSPEVFNRMRDLFAGGYIGDHQAREVIRRTFKNYHYLLDTHTAVAVGVYEEYLRQTGDPAKTIVLSTASPYKFPSAVLGALGEEGEGEGYQLLKRLSETTGTPIPPSLDKLWEKPIRFERIIPREAIRSYLSDRLSL